MLTSVGSCFLYWAFLGFCWCIAHQVYTDGENEDYPWDDSKVTGGERGCHGVNECHKSQVDWVSPLFVCFVFLLSKSSLFCFVTFFLLWFWKLDSVRNSNSSSMKRSRMGDPNAQDQFQTRLVVAVVWLFCIKLFGSKNWFQKPRKTTKVPGPCTSWNVSIFMFDCVWRGTLHFCRRCCLIAIQTFRLVAEVSVVRNSVFGVERKTNFLLNWQNWMKKQKHCATVCFAFFQQNN